MNLKRKRKNKKKGGQKCPPYGVIQKGGSKRALPF